MLRISDLPVISLDLETGGLVPGTHTPLSIGAVVVPGGGNLIQNEIYEVTDKNSFYIQLEWDTVVVTPQAMKINNLDIANPPGPNGTIINCSLPGEEGLRYFADWLAQHHNVDQLIYALGVNVGSFDLPMLRSIWKGPGATLWPFHYRSIDLNSLFFALSQIQNKSFSAIKKEITQIAWKKNEFSNKMEHHALADAWSNVYVWEECLKRFGGDCEVLC